MQPILATPRTQLNETLVRSLLQGDVSITVAYGAEWLDSTLTLVKDITSFMSDGSTIDSDVTATIHRSCTLMFDSDVPFNYVTDFVKPYMVLTNNDTGFTARFDLGVYTLETPTMDESTTPSVLSFAGYDLLYYLNQPIGDSFQMNIGSDPADIAAGLIATAVPHALVSLDESGTSTTQVYTWPFDSSTQSTYLDVVNAMLKMIGYSPVWVDWEGTFQVHPFVDPQIADIEWDFDLTTDDNIVAETRNSSQDFFDVPNYWVFIMQNQTTAPVEGTTQVTYIDDQSTNPGSFPNRGRYIKKIVFVDAPDFATLFAQAVVTITDDLSPSENFAFSTSPFPLAWHKDIILLTDPNISTIPPRLSAIRRIQSLDWHLALDGTADMTWNAQAVNAVLATTDSG